MGLFRKWASISTLGAVDMRSDKERTARKTAKGARYAKVAAKQAKAQARIMQTEQLQQRAAAERAQKAAARPLPERLAEVDSLCQAGAITAAERDARRAEILRDI